MKEEFDLPIFTQNIYVYKSYNNKVFRDVNNIKGKGFKYILVDSADADDIQNLRKLGYIPIGIAQFINYI